MRTFCFLLFPFIASGFAAPSFNNCNLSKADASLAMFVQSGREITSELPAQLVLLRDCRE